MDAEGLQRICLGCQNVFEQEASLLRTRLEDLEARKAAETAELKEILKRKDEEKANLLKVAAEILVFCEKQCENNHKVIVRRHCEVIERKNELWIERMQLVRQNCGGSLSEAKSTAEKSCSPLRPMHINRATSPRNEIFVKQRFSVWNRAFPKSLYKESKPKGCKMLGKTQIVSPNRSRTRINFKG